MHNFQGHTLNNSEPDSIHWRWSSQGIFTVHSLYEWLDYGCIPNKTFQFLWKSKLPFKIKIFLWLVRQNRILTKDNLRKRGWQGDSSCHFCSHEESVNHLFVTCPFISQIWNWIAQFNGFYFDCTLIQDLWLLDAYIPLKDMSLL